MKHNYKLWQIIAIFLIGIGSSLVGVKNLSLFVDFITPEEESVNTKGDCLKSIPQTNLTGLE